VSHLASTCHLRERNHSRSGLRSAAWRRFPDFANPLAPILWRKFLSVRNCLVTGLILIAATAVILLAMGRIAVCDCGYVLVWTPASDVSGSSQHIADWYTPSHIIHGFLFYWWHRAASRRGSCA
jgi:hypothetical protein